MMANAYFDESDFDNINKNHDILKNISYMNINKRGGSNRTKASDLRKYAVNYKDYIKREIELIDPDLIVCCSGLVYDTEMLLLCFAYNINKLHNKTAKNRRRTHLFEKLIA